MLFKEGKYSRSFVRPSVIPADNVCPEHILKTVSHIAFEDGLVQSARTKTIPLIKAK